MRYGNGIMRIRYLMRRNMKHVIPAVTFIAFMCGSCAMTRLYPLNEAFPEISTYYNPKGSIEELFYKTEARPGYRRAIVYLPEGYRDNDVSYPVLYLLHGANGNETSWITKGMIFREIDKLIKRGEMKKAIVVFPNMNQYDNEKDFGKQNMLGMVLYFLISHQHSSREVSVSVSSFSGFMFFNIMLMIIPINETPIIVSSI